MSVCGSEAQCWLEVEFLCNRRMISHNAEGTGAGAVLRRGALMGFDGYKPDGVKGKTWWER